MNSRLGSFNPLWLRDPEFKRWVAKAPGDPQKALCLLCDKDFIIGDQGHRALKAHSATARHRMRTEMAARSKRDQSSSDRRESSPAVRPSSRSDSLAQKPQATQLSRFERDDQLVPLLDNGWNMVDGRDAVNKTFLFQSFNEAWSWMSRVALAGERMGHHPEWFNVYNTVQITWITPDCNGISARDIKMAHFCDSTYKYYK